MTQFTSEFSSSNRMIVLSETNEEIAVGCCESADTQTKKRTERVLRAKIPGKKIIFRRMNEHELMLAVAGSIPRSPRKKGDFDGTHSNFDIHTIESGAPAITLLNGILLEARSRNASDIYLEMSGQTMTMRLRIDGLLQNIRTFDENAGRAISIRIKLIANLNTLEMRKPQDGRFNISALGIEHDVRVSIVPSINGESISLRFLDTVDSDIRLESLGFSQPVFTELTKIPSLSRGLVLVTGPTGSGKTTTLAALIKECNPMERKIISIEDPVEYRINGVTQIQTNDNIGLDFGTLLKRILRQDPDVIMIGEIRDAETAALAVRAALTGHLVFSTLHTGNALEARNRLLDMGVPAYILDSVLRAVIAQRLVRKLGEKGDFLGRIPIAEFYIPAQDKKPAMTHSFDIDCNRLLTDRKTTQDEVKRVFGENV